MYSVNIVWYYRFFDRGAALAQSSLQKVGEILCLVLWVNNGSAYVLVVLEDGVSTGTRLCTCFSPGRFDY